MCPRIAHWLREHETWYNLCKMSPHNPMVSVGSKSCSYKYNYAFHKCMHARTHTRVSTRTCIHTHKLLLAGSLIHSMVSNYNGKGTKWLNNSYQHFDRCHMNRNEYFYDCCRNFIIVLNHLLVLLLCLCHHI